MISSTQTAVRAQPLPPGHFVVPFLGRFYGGFAQPLAWVGFRALVGGALLYEGLPKIMAPLAQSGFVESLHFYPGWFWSPFLAVLQVLGGLAIAVGVLTRPFALANAVMLAITLYFHVSHPYGDTILTEAGRSFFASGDSGYLTHSGVARLADGGGPFLAIVQEKAEMLSLLWTGAVAFFAAYGGGPLSIDAHLGREV